jgi:hypothetical protein
MDRVCGFIPKGRGPKKEGTVWSFAIPGPKNTKTILFPSFFWTPSLNKIGSICGKCGLI